MANSAVIVIVYAYLAWIAREPALKLFTWGWALYTLHFAGLCAYVLSGNTSHGALVLNATAAVASSAILLFAALRLAGRSTPRWAWCAAGAGLAGVAAASYVRPALWLSPLPANVITGVIFILLGSMFFTARKLPLAEARITGTLFSLLGLCKLSCPWQPPSGAFAPWCYVSGAILGLLGALGVVLCYLQLARRAAAQTHRDYRNLVEFSPYPILVHRGNRLLFANLSAAALLGAASPQGVIGKNLREVLEATEIEPLKPAPCGSRGGQEREFIVTPRAASGDACRLRTVGFDIDFEDGPARLVYCQDVTGQRQIEQRLRQHERLRNLGALAGGIAHDFNNMLMAIQGFTEIVRDQLPLTSNSRDSLKEVLQACRRATGLIQQILQFARREEQEARELEIAPEIQAALRLMRAGLPSSVIFEVLIDPAAEDAVVVADPTALHQVVMNLCTNAAHAMPHGGLLTASLMLADVGEQQARAIAGMCPGKYVLLAVSDTGTGIPPEVLPRIFEPFYTTKPLGAGTGMGLSLVRGIVDSMGGAITVQTELGQGTEFAVYLPAVAVALAPAQPSVHAPLPCGQGRVLVVDDETAVLKLLEQMVARLGYLPLACADARDALAEVRRNPAGFCAVLTNQTMPHLSGTALARELALAAPGLPVIILSGCAASIAPELVQDTLVKAVLSKPLSLRDLAEALSAHANGPRAGVRQA